MGFNSILSLSALLLVMLADLNYGFYFRNDYTYEFGAKGWMKLHMMPQTWDDARLRCFLEGSNLASPLNEKILEAMRKYMGKTVNETFTGISAMYYKEEFESIGGISLDTMRIAKHWVPGEPNHDGLCISLNREGLLADVNCKKNLPFICYKRNYNGSVSLKPCGTADPEYLFEKRTGQCYKLHRFGRTWSKAFMTCAAEGGYLAIINSDIEAQVLRNLVSMYPANTIHAGRSDVFAIGFHDWSDYGVWMTVHGKTLKEAGYEKWSADEPNSNIEGTREYCGSMFTDATLNDVNCEFNIPFICEKRPESLVEDEYRFNDEEE